MVSIPEYLDFFLTSPDVRRARSATAAVRASLNLLQLESTVDDQEVSAWLSIEIIRNNIFMYNLFYLYNILKYFILTVLPHEIVEPSRTSSGESQILRSQVS